MKNVVAIKYLFPISVAVLMLTQSGRSTPPTFDIITWAEHPKHFESLAVNHDILRTKFMGWNIKSTARPLQQKDIVSVTVDIKVPREIAKKGVDYVYGLIMRFQQDTLFNYEEIMSAGKRVEEVIDFIENNRFIRTIRCNADVKSEYLYWTGAGYRFLIQTESGDTLETFTGWPSPPGGGMVMSFNFVNPNLIDLIEVFTGPTALAEIYEFKKMVGIGIVRNGSGGIQVSSDKECSYSNSCFSYAVGLVTSFKLSMKSEWRNFPYLADALKEVNYLLLTEGDTECFYPYLPPDIPFAIMCHQQNTLPRRIYFPILCKNKVAKVLSVQVDNEGSKIPTPHFHEPLILDSLLAELKWEQEKVKKVKTGF